MRRFCKVCVIDTNNSMNVKDIMSYPVLTIGNLSKSSSCYYNDDEKWVYTRLLVACTFVVD
jgi:hypothetical protein